MQYIAYTKKEIKYSASTTNTTFNNISNFLLNNNLLGQFYTNPWF
jgi:hypothetical protein